MWDDQQKDLPNPQHADCVENLYQRVVSMIFPIRVFIMSSQRKDNN